jgi:hypothetical protein
MRWAWNVADMGEMINTHNILVGKLERKRPLRRPGLIWNDKGNRVGRCGLNTSGSGYGPVMDPCEYGNEILDSIEGREFLDQLSDNYVLKKDSAPWG